MYIKSIQVRKSMHACVKLCNLLYLVEYLLTKTYTFSFDDKDKHEYKYICIVKNGRIRKQIYLG